MKSLHYIILTMFWIPFTYGQVQLTADELQTIDFTGYTGSGFTPTPSAGQLDSDTWAANGMSDGNLSFGGTDTTGDFARGMTSSPVNTGGFYALDDGGNTRFMIQPGGSDWTPGDLILKIQNVTGTALTKLNLEYQVYINNDQPRANSFNFSYSFDNVSYSNISGFDYTSPEASDAAGWVLAVTRTTSIIGLSVANNDFIYLRWTGDDVSGSGNRDEFALDNILLSPEDVPLPVELSSFSAIVLDDAIKLNWRTETEVSNFGFDIERSEVNPKSEIGNPQFSKIGFVEGNGNSNSPKNYSFMDETVNAGRYSYRLKQIDTDGQFEYSKIIEINFGSPAKFELSQNYPNPFNPSTAISFTLPQSGDVSLKVYNTIGQQVTELVNGYKEAGIHTVNFSASEFNSGVYFYRLETKGFSELKKMILVK